MIRSKDKKKRIPRRIGIHGARNSGKTCYLACLYGHPTTEEAVFTFEGNDTIDHLKNGWDVLCSGDLIPANAVTRPIDLDMLLIFDNMTRSMHTYDYAGALVQRTDAGDPGLAKEVKQWLTNCHAILFFVNSDEADGEGLRERLTELGMLILELLKLSSDGRTIATPLGIVLTKWDTQGPISVDPLQEESRALAFLRSRASFKHIQETVQKTGVNVKVFPVSAFGEHRDGNRPPEGGPQPFNLHAPLLWAVQVTDELLYERTKREVDALLGQRRLRKPFTKAIERYSSLASDYGIDNGPLHEKTVEALAPIRLKRRTRRIAVGLLTALIALAGLGAERFYSDAAAYHNLLAMLSDPAAQPQQIRAEHDRYLAQLNPWGMIPGRRDEIQRKIGERFDAWEVNDFRALEKHRNENPGPERAEARFKACQDFLKKWPLGPRSQKTAAWASEDDNNRQEHSKTLEVERALTAVDAELSRLEGDPQQCIEVCDRFLEQFSDSPHPKQKEMIEKARAKRDALVIAGEEKLISDIVAYAQSHPNNFDEIVKRAAEYARRPNSVHQGRANEIIKETERRWDRAEYGKLENAAKEARNSAGLLYASDAAKRYVNDAHPLKKCKDHAEKWLEWFNGLSQPRDYYVTVRSIFIPEGSDLAEVAGDERTMVHVRINDVEHSTGSWRAGRSPKINEKLGPYRVKWGEEQSLQVRVEERDYDSPNDWADSGKIVDKLFVLGYANGIVGARCIKNKDVEVMLECPAAVPPALPPYPEE